MPMLSSQIAVNLRTAADAEVRSHIIYTHPSLSFFTSPKEHFLFAEGHSITMFSMKNDHPSARMRNMRPRHAVVSSTSKKLWRLPHIFAKVLELPFHSDADVSIEETPQSFRFTASANNFPNGVRAHPIEILPGITKIVIRGMDGRDLQVSQLDLWRFRLPASTRPEMATAVCSGRKLVVTVPKSTGFGGN